MGAYASLTLIILFLSNSLLTSLFYLIATPFMFVAGFRFLKADMRFGLAWLAAVALITFGMAYGANKVGVGFSRCIKCTNEYDVQSCACESEMKEWIGRGKRWPNWDAYVKDRMAEGGSMCEETNSCCQSCIDQHNGYR